MKDIELEAFAGEVNKFVGEKLEPVSEKVSELTERLDDIAKQPAPVNGQDGKDGAEGAKGDTGEKGADGLGLDISAWAEGVYREGAIVQANFGQAFRALVDTAKGVDSEDWERIGTNGFRLTGPYSADKTYQPGDLFIKDFGLFLHDGNEARLIAGRGPEGKKGKQGPAGKDGLDGQDGADGKDGSQIEAMEIKDTSLVLVVKDADGQVKSFDTDLAPFLEAAVEVTKSLNDDHTKAQADEIEARVKSLWNNLNEHLTDQQAVPVRFYRGLWLPSTAYQVGDMVTYSSGQYLCRQSNTGVMPFGQLASDINSGDYWVQFSSGSGGGTGEAGEIPARITTDMVATNPSVTFRDSKGRFKTKVDLTGLTDQLKVNRFVADELDALVESDSDLQKQIDELKAEPEAPELPEDRLPIFAEDEPTEYPYAEDGESTDLQVEDQWYQVTDPDFDYEKPESEGLDLYIWTQVDGDFEWVLFEPEEEIEYATLEHSDSRDNALQLQIDELEQEIDIIAPRLEAAQYKYVAAPSVKPGEMHIASGSFTRADDIVFFNDTALDGTTHAWGSLHVGDYLEITDTQEKDSRTAENYAMYLVTQEPEGEGMKQIQVSLVKGVGAPAVDDILDAKGFQLGGNDINDLDARYIKTGGESETTGSIVIKSAEGSSHNFGLHSQDNSTAFWIKNKANNYIFSVQNDGRLIAGPENSPFIATKANHITTKSYVDSQIQSSSGSPRLLHSGWDIKYKYVALKSLDQKEFALNSSASSANTMYLFKAWNQDGYSVRVLDYQATQDSYIEIWEYDTSNPMPVLRAGIKKIEQSVYSQHDSKITLERIWGKPSYTFNTYRYYSFVIRGLSVGASSASIDIPDDKFGEVEE